MAVAPRAFRLAPGMVVTPVVPLCRASPFLTELVASEALTRRVPLESSDLWAEECTLRRARSGQYIRVGY